jgi:hypothetical protein
MRKERLDFSSSSERLRAFSTTDLRSSPTFPDRD